MLDFSEGYTASQVDGDSYSGFNKLGFTAGAFINRLIAYDIYWQVEIKYVTRGVYKGPTDNDPTLYRSGYHYVEIPIIGSLPAMMRKSRWNWAPRRKYWSEPFLRTRMDSLIPADYPENPKVWSECIWRRTITGSTLPPGWECGIPIRPFHFRDPQEWNHPQIPGLFPQCNLPYRWPISSLHH